MVPYNFLRGHPNRGALPVAHVQSLLRLVAANNHDSDTHDDGDNIYSNHASSVSPLEPALNYLASDPGDPRALAALQAFLERHDTPLLSAFPSSSLSFTTTPALSYFWTHGVSHGLDLLCTALTQPDPNHHQQTQTQQQHYVVWLEQPTYFLAAQIFTSRHFQLRALPMRSPHDGGGIDVDQFCHLLASGNVPPPLLVYLIPTHQNPTGTTMSLSDRCRLIQLARRYNFYLVADEVYHLLDWGQDVQQQQPQQPPTSQDDKITSRPPRMAVLGGCLPPIDDNANNNINNNIHEDTDPNHPYHQHHNPCISVSSFTKIYCPGIRVGWIEASSDVIEKLVNLGYIQSQGSCAPFMGEVMRVATTRRQCDEVLANLVDLYRQRCALLCSVLQTEPRIVIYHIPTGGYFLWVAFDGVEDTEDLLEYCRERGVTFLAGRRCGAFVSEEGKGKDGESNDAYSDTPHFNALDWCKRSARLCFADLDVPELEQGAQLLIQCYRDYASTSVLR